LRSAPGINELGDRGDELAALVDRARTRVPFYRRHLADVRHVELAALPSCTKADLRPFGRFPLAEAGDPLRGLHRVSATSGTTGPRLFVGYTRRDWESVGRKLARVGEHVGFGAGDSLLNVLGSGLWIGGPSFDLMASVCGATLVGTGPTGPDQIVDLVPDLGISHITATPSYLRLLVETAARDGIDLGGWPLRMGFIGGEGASAELRRQVCAAFDGRFTWLETYGSTESGGPILGYAPPDDPLCGQLNAATDEFVIELLHPERDEPVAPGEQGELTLTAFREAAPLIRYRTRDLACEVDAARDRSGLPRISAVRARLDDALKVRGTLVYPSVVDDVLLGALPAGAEWRIELTRATAGLDVLAIRVELDDATAADTLEPLTRAVHQRIQVRPVLSAVPPGSLDRFPGKARRVVDLRPPD
jgi:phenylacetate-CoA ligase